MSNPPGYAPIRLRGNGPVTMELPYSFVYDLEMLGGSSNGGNVNEPFVPGGARRKRRQVSDGESQLQRTLQTVEVSFRPVEVGTTDLLHTESKDFIHQLRVSSIPQREREREREREKSHSAFACISMLQLCNIERAALKKTGSMGMRLEPPHHSLLPAKSKSLVNTPVHSPSTFSNSNK